MSALFISVFVSIPILAGFFIGFNLFLFAFLMLLGGLVAFLYPRAGILAIIFLTFIFERFFTLQPIIIGRAEYKLYPVDILFGVVILGTFLQLGVRKARVRLEKADLWLGAFLLASTGYFIYAVSILDSEAALAFSTFKNYAFYALFYFLVLIHFQDRKSWGLLFKTGLAGALAILFFIGYGLVSGNGLWSEYTPLSTEGVRLLAFTHAFYLSLVLIGAIAYLVFNSGMSFPSAEADKLQRESRFQVKPGMTNGALYILIAIWSFGIVASMMRHLWLALAAAFGMLYWIIPRERRKRLTSLLIKSLLIALLVSVFFFYLAQIFPQSPARDLTYSAGSVLKARFGSLVGVKVAADESFSWRSAVWRAAFKDYSRQPLFGIGFGKLIFIEIDKYRDSVEVRNIHNSPLILLVQMGLVGIFTLGILLVTQTFRFFRSLCHEDWRDHFLLAAWIFYLVAFLFQPYLETNLLGIFFWILLGLIRIRNYEAE